VIVISYRSRELAHRCTKLEVAQQWLGPTNAQALIDLIADAEALENARALIDFYDAKIHEGDSLSVGFSPQCKAVLTPIGLLAERGIIVSYETVRRWCKKFGQSFANRLRRRRPQPGDKWYLDEVFIRVQGVQHYLWRAVDQDGVVLDILVQPRRDAQAAKRFFRRLLKGLQYVPRVIVTDKLRSYGVAQRQLLPKVEHRQSRYLNNRAENSHRPTRRRERQMQRFKSPGQAQSFLSAHAFIHGHFHPRRHLLTANSYRAIRTDAFNIWRQETCTQYVV
jgi:putative transposase